jgi:hypothetical protein
MVDFENTEQTVIDLFSRDELCRNSFKYMILKRWNEQAPEVLEKIVEGDTEDLQAKDLGKLDNPRTLVRVGASLQNDKGMYPPTDPKVIDDRADNYEQFKEWALENNKVPEELAKEVGRAVKVDN